tara:strand:+ start:718 stop:1758 length:1041 start_codon:yes stop_codon:yes gene_type:complete
MAITNTLQSKEFVAGSSPIILKGDYRPKIASAPDPMDERNNALENLANQYYNKPLKDLSPKEIELLEEALDEMTKKNAPSMMMAADGGRAQYGLGSLVKSIGKAVKGVVKGVKDNPLLAAAALNFAPMAFGKSPFLGFGKLTGSIGTIPGFSNLLGLKEGADKMNALKVAGAGSVITGLLAGMEQQEGESNTDFANRQAEVRDQLNVQFKRLYPQEGNESDEDYNIRINAMVEAADDSTIDVGNMADGGRVNRAMGSDEKVEMAAGIEGLPININSKGVKEVDLRETGGFIPPVGIKEKADDIPAMLSNNEFVFTADAVRAAGGGSVNKGAQRMYDLMKNLESKVV